MWKKLKFIKKFKKIMANQNKHARISLTNVNSLFSLNLVEKK